MKLLNCLLSLSVIALVFWVVKKLEDIIEDRDWRLIWRFTRDKTKVLLHRLTAHFRSPPTFDGRTLDLKPMGGSLENKEVRRVADRMRPIAASVEFIEAASGSLTLTVEDWIQLFPNIQSIQLWRQAKYKYETIGQVTMQTIPGPALTD